MKQLFNANGTDRYQRKIEKVPYLTINFHQSVLKNQPMETIQSFLKKHGFRDCMLGSYTADDIKKIERVINGDLSDCENNGNASNYAGLCISNSIFSPTNKEKDAEYFYLIGFKKDNHYSSCNLGSLHYTNGKFELAEYFFWLSVKMGNAPAMGKLGILYGNQKKFELAEKYHLMAIENGCLSFIDDLAKLYCNQNKFELAEKYYLIAIENEDDISVNNLGMMYYNQKKFELAEKYFLIAIDKNIKMSIFNLWCLYNSNKYKSELANQYYTQAIEIADGGMMELIHKSQTNKLKFYITLSNFKNKTDVIQQKIYSLSSLPEVSDYINRKNVWGKVGDCSVCLSNALLVPMECTHFYCEECYVKVEKCFCKMPK